MLVFGHVLRLTYSDSSKAHDFHALEKEALHGVEELKTPWSADDVADRCVLAACGVTLLACLETWSDGMSAEGSHF